MQLYVTHYLGLHVLCRVECHTLTQVGQQARSSDKHLPTGRTSSRIQQTFLKESRAWAKFPTCTPLQRITTDRSSRNPGNAIVLLQYCVLYIS